MLCGTGVDGADVSYRRNTETYISCATFSYDAVRISNRPMPPLSYQLSMSFMSDRGTTLPESFPPGTPIQTTITASDPPRPKPRGSGKLLTTIDDVGLALLRIEHVDSVQVGEMGMEIVSTEGEKARVLPRRLGWWPVAEFGEA